MGPRRTLHRAFAVSAVYPRRVVVGCAGQIGGLASRPARVRAGSLLGIPADSDAVDLGGDSGDRPAAGGSRTPRLGLERCTARHHAPPDSPGNLSGMEPGL